MLRCSRTLHRRLGEGRPAAKLALDTADGAYALVLLDLGLPRKSGLDLLKEIRRAGNKVRVLVVTARDAVADRVAGLDAGADDYLVKPFSLDELGARMRALLRRDIAREDNVLRNGDLALDPAARTVTRQGALVEVSTREFALLAALLERPGTALSKSQLEERLYGWGRKWRATRSRFTSTTCARSWAPTRSARSAAWAT